MRETTKHAPGTVCRVAYLTGQYPAVSHTFILREVEAVRALGTFVQTCSVRRTGAEHHTGEAEKAAAQNTFYVLEAAKDPATLLRGVGAALAHPRRFWSALQLAVSTRPAGLRALIYQFFYLAEAVVLACFLRDEKIDHLHNHFADSSATVAMLAAEISGIPFSYTLHGPAELFEPLRWRLDIKTERAAFVACISHFCRSQAMYFSDPAQWHKLRIIHCGVLPTLYETPKVSTGAGTHFIFVGRLTAIKGLRVLIEAFGRARETRPDIHLTLVGDGMDRAFLEDAAARFDGAVRFTGYLSQTEVAAMLRGADVFVLPSFAEGLPVVLMEALASGTPVICTRVAGVSELVEDGVHGYLVPAGDAESLAARMADISSDPDLRVRMGKAGRAKVAAEFDVSHEAALIQALFEGRGGDAPRPQLAGG